MLTGDEKSEQSQMFVTVNLQVVVAQRVNNALARKHVRT